MPVSNCCSAPFIVGYKEDGERCSACKEHCGEEEENEGTLFIDADSFTLNELRGYVSRHNPKEIVMSRTQAEYYASLMFEPPKDIFKMQFRGIPVKIQV